MSRDSSHSSPPQLWYVPEQDISPDPTNLAISLHSRAKQAVHYGIFLFRELLVHPENSCTYCPNAGVPSPGHGETVYNSLGKPSWSNSEVLRLRSCCGRQVPLMKRNSAFGWLNKQLRGQRTALWLSVCLTCARNYTQFHSLISNWGHETFTSPVLTPEGCHASDPNGL